MLGGTRPVMIAKKLKTEFIKFETGMEIIIDVSSNFIAARVMDLCVGMCRELVVDLGFLLQGSKSDELPERLLGAAQMCYVDINRAMDEQDSPDAKCPLQPSERCTGGIGCSLAAEDPAATSGPPNLEKMQDGVTVRRSVTSTLVGICVRLMAICIILLLLEPRFRSNLEFMLDHFSP
eukprot:gene19340-23126_t